MEEKDIKIIEDITPDDLLNCWSGGMKEYETIKKLLQAYKQDEKMIEEIKTMVYGEISCAERNYDIEELNDYAKGIYDTFKAIEKIFRKKCE